MFLTSSHRSFLRGKGVRVRATALPGTHGHHLASSHLGEQAVICIQTLARDARGPLWGPRPSPHPGFPPPGNAATGWPNTWAESKLAGCQWGLPHGADGGCGRSRHLTGSRRLPTQQPEQPQSTPVAQTTVHRTATVPEPTVPKSGTSGVSGPVGATAELEQRLDSLQAALSS